jgi:DnaJ-class molecular chaperone
VSPELSTEDCVDCDGTGTVERPHPSGYEEHGTILAKCVRCHGEGWTLVLRDVAS